MADIEQIIRDWRDEFPLLNSYTRSSLFMRADMVLIGLRIDKSDIFPESYGIRNSYGLILEILPLWKEDKNERVIPVFFGYVHDKRWFSTSVYLDWHERKFERTKNDIQDSFGLILKDEIRVSDLYNIIYKHLYRYGRIPCVFYMWLKVYELQLAIALYFDNSELMKETKAYIENEIRHWGRAFFEERVKMPVQQWLDELYAKFSDRERFMEIIQQNCARKKVSKLNQAHFICDLPVNTAGNGFFSRLLRHLGF